VKLAGNGIRGHAVADLPREVLSLLEYPDAIFALQGTRVLKDSRTSTVASVVLPFADGPRELILKRVNVRHWTELVKNLLRPSAVLRSWINGHTLRDRWLPTPRPLAVLHRYRFALPAEGYLLTEKVEEPSELSALATPSFRELARMLRMMHDRGVSHRDLKASNILLERGKVPTLVDLVGVRIGPTVPFTRRARELARLNASFLSSPNITRTVRLRFLRTYLAAGERLPHEWKTCWKEISRATQAKIAKNQRTGRPLA
jgi:serine/threonine protein kinase